MTMFEVGKLSDESLESFLMELDRVSAFENLYVDKMFGLLGNLCRDSDKFKVLITLSPFIYFYFVVLFFQAGGEYLFIQLPSHIELRLQKLKNCAARLIFCT